MWRFQSVARVDRAFQPTPFCPAPPSMAQAAPSRMPKSISGMGLRRAQVIIPVRSVAPLTTFPWASIIPAPSAPSTCRSARSLPSTGSVAHPYGRGLQPRQPRQRSRLNHRRLLRTRYLHRPQRWNPSHPDQFLPARQRRRRVLWLRRPKSLPVRRTNGVLVGALILHIDAREPSVTGASGWLSHPT